MSKIKASKKLETARRIEKNNQQKGLDAYNPKHCAMCGFVRDPEGRCICQ